MTTILICDNNAEQLEHTYQFVTAYCRTINNVTIKTIRPKQLSDLLAAQKLSASILITEIELGDYDGLSLARQTNKVVPCCNIIYLCRKLENALAVYETRHLYFVLKEQMSEILPKALVKAFQEQTQKVSDYFNFKSQSRHVSLPQKEICYISKEGRYSYVHTAAAVYQCSYSISKLAEILNSEWLVRCHYGYIVNLSSISAFSKTGLTLEEQEVIPVGRTFYKQARDAYLKQLSAHTVSQSLCI